MRDDIKSIGKYGESAAVRYLRRNGYRIIGRNVRESHKEIDIIAENKNDIVFVEVKTSFVDGDIDNIRPAVMVDFDKRKNTAYAASAYLKSHPSKSKLIRIDVIEVYVAKSNRIFGRYRTVRLNHIENAFGAGGQI